MEELIHTPEGTLKTKYLSITDIRDIPIGTHVLYTTTMYRRYVRMNNECGVIVSEHQPDYGTRGGYYIRFCDKEVGTLLRQAEKISLLDESCCKHKES